MKRKPGKSKRKRRKQSSVRKTVGRLQQPTVKHSSELSLEKFNRLEFHRHGFALIPEPTDRNPGIAVLASLDDNELCACECTCKKGVTCKHKKELIMLRELLIEDYHENLNYSVFLDSIWYRLASIMADDPNYAVDTTEIRIAASDQKKEVIFEDRRLNPILTYIADGNDACRFKERIRTESEKQSKYSRYDAIKLLMNKTLTEAERDFMNYGMMSGRQKIEKNFWYLFGYHIFREFGLDGILVDVPIDLKAEDLVVVGKTSQDCERFRMPVSGRNAIKVIQLIKDSKRNTTVPEVSLTSMQPKFRLFRDDSDRKILIPFVELNDDNGNTATYDLDKQQKKGGLFYIRDHNLLINVGNTDPNLPFSISRRSVINEDQLLKLLSWKESGEQNNRIHFDISVDDLKIYQRPDTLVVTSAMYDKDWCWISLEYGVGNTSLSLHSFLEKRTDKNRYVKVEKGWVDMGSAPFEAVRTIISDVVAENRVDKSGCFKLSRCELLLLHTAFDAEIKVSGDNAASTWIRRFMALQPVEAVSSIDGMVTPLRKYQLIGFNWMRFLYENGLGGLLCDDMGLGKTHQVMALLAHLVKNKQISDPVIVICPTTVMHHWFEKIEVHTDLKVHVFHGNKRDLTKCLETHQIIITSYGVLRNDSNLINSFEFALAIFDEVQYLKNPETLSFNAAKGMRARAKIGLTGTPIENNLMELHSLFSIVLPGLLGSARKFETTYLKSRSALENNENRCSLKRLTSPFTLRRLKTMVLQELPKKIEDVRICFLSEDQVTLYRDTIAERGHGLKKIIQMDTEPIPYLHIFAVLNLLKQICNHPSLVNGHFSRYQEYSSGKWELFKELLEESLDSGNKVVVFTQYLGMIDIMERYLKMRKIPFATLTGSTRDRGEVIKRFNMDDDCRVFLGSLRAGGTGIDLVSGSVVIHYDRWWNAALEDQATDRIHRIGQTKVVQVFKLVTKGTLEEKISAIIERKRRILSEFVQTDDPGLVKAFSKGDLIAILSDVKN